MDAMPPAPTDPAAEALQLASTEIPEALDELGRKHDYVNDVVQWCESSYQTGDKNMVLKQTKNISWTRSKSSPRKVETTSGEIDSVFTTKRCGGGPGPGIRCGARA